MISVIISTRWASELLELLIESLLRYQKFDNEIIIVADSPSWQVVKLLQDRGFILGSGKKLSYHIVNHQHLEMNWNYGADFATFEYLAFCPDDTVVGPNWDSETLKTMNNSKRRIVHLPMFQMDVPIEHMHYGDFGVPEWKYSEVHKRARKSPIGLWNWEAFEKAKNIPPTIGGVFWTLHKELFELANHYTFHVAHPLGQELAFYELCQRSFNADRTAAFGSYCLHWGTGGNSDMQKTCIGISNGFFECSQCKHRDPGLHQDLWNKDERSITNVKTGHYLCERCKKDGYRIENYKVIK